jgi:hypothetical protein
VAVSDGLVFDILALSSAGIVDAIVRRADGGKPAEMPIDPTEHARTVEDARAAIAHAKEVVAHATEVLALCRLIREDARVSLEQAIAARELTDLVTRTGALIRSLQTEIRTAEQLVRHSNN